MERLEFGPVDHITVGTIGPPGSRVFFLQASEGTTVVSLIIEKEQAHALAVALAQLLDELESHLELPPARPEEIPPGDLELRLPVEALFRVSQIGIGYDQNRDLILIAAQELILEEEEREPLVVRFWATRSQMAALSRRAIEVVNAGRPICALCGQPIDPEGHFCPRSNGHAHD